MRKKRSRSREKETETDKKLRDRRSRSKSPARKSKSTRDRSRSPRRRSKSPLKRSRSPAKASRSPAGGSRSPLRKKSSLTSKPRSRSRSKERQRSRSRSRSKQRRRSRSSSRSKQRKRSRSSSRSKQRKRSRSPSRSKQRQWSRSRSRSNQRQRTRSCSRSPDRRFRKRRHSRSRSRSVSRRRHSRRQRSHSSSSSSFSSRSPTRSNSPSPERHTVTHVRYLSPPQVPRDEYAYNTFPVPGREPRLHLRPLSPVTKDTVYSVLQNAWSCYYSRFYSMPQPSMAYVLEAQLAFLRAYEGFFSFPPRFDNYYTTLQKPEDLKDALQLRIMRRSPGPLAPQHKVYDSPQQWCDSTTDIREFRHEMVRDLPRKETAYLPHMGTHPSPPVPPPSAPPTPHLPMYVPTQPTLPPPVAAHQLFPPDHLAYSMSALIRAGNIPGLSAGDIDQNRASTPPTQITSTRAVDNTSLTLYPGHSYLGYPIRTDLPYAAGQQQPMSVAFVPGYGKPSIPGIADVTPVSKKFPPSAAPSTAVGSPDKKSLSLPLDDKPVVLDLTDNSPPKEIKSPTESSLISVSASKSNSESSGDPHSRSPQKTVSVTQKPAAFTDLAAVKTGNKQPVQKTSRSSLGDLVLSRSKSDSAESFSTNQIASSTSRVAAAIKTAKSFTAPISTASHTVSEKSPLRIPISKTSKKAQPERYTPREDNFRSERSTAPSQSKSSSNSGQSSSEQKAEKQSSSQPFTEVSFEL